jgi:hypothetical protein
MKIDLTSENLILINLILLFTLKIVVFILGFLAIRIGAKLLREGVRGEFKFKAEFTGTTADLQSGSPGLLFTLLGIILIGFAMAYNKEIPHKKERRIILNSSNGTRQLRNKEKVLLLPDQRFRLLYDVSRGSISVLSPV